MGGPVRGLPLQQLVAISQGQLPQSVIDDLVLDANGGVDFSPLQETTDAVGERVIAINLTGGAILASDGGWSVQ